MCQKNHPIRCLRFRPTISSQLNMAHSQRTVRSLTLADHDQLKEICKDVYGGLDQTPQVFPALVSNPKVYSHAVVDENDRLMGFQFIDIIDEGRTAYFHTLRVSILLLILFWSRYFSLCWKITAHSSARHHKHHLIGYFHFSLTGRLFCSTSRHRLLPPAVSVSFRSSNSRYFLRSLQHRHP